MNKLYGIKSGYVERETTTYYPADMYEKRNITHQPHVYTLAAFLARRFQCSTILDIGCGRGYKLVNLYPEFKIIGVDYGENIQYCQSKYAYGTWIEFDLEQPDLLKISDEVVRNSVIVCADVIEHLLQPEHLLHNLKALLEHAPVALLSTPERDRVHGTAHFGPPSNPYHVREWNMEELGQFLRSEGLHIDFLGLTQSNDQSPEKRTMLAVLANQYRPRPGITAPEEFRVAAVMPCYNEVDILETSVKHLAEQGVEVYIVDNWSDDGSYELAKSLEGVIDVEHFPSEEPKPHVHNWEPLLAHIAQRGQTLGVDWLIFQDIDEIRESPWPNISLRDAIYYAHLCGYNAIDHTVIEFFPVDDDFEPGTDFKSYFQYYEFGRRSGLFKQIKTWKASDGVLASESGGHGVKMVRDMNIFPYKFLMRHYPLRSQQQTVTKIINRQKHTNASARARGWHTQYDGYNADNDALFRTICHQTKARCSTFDASTFYEMFLVERLSGIGIEVIKKPFLKKLRHYILRRSRKILRSIR